MDCIFRGVWMMAQVENMHKVNTTLNGKWQKAYFVTPACERKNETVTVELCL